MTDKVVDCETHGRSEAAFVCKHLAAAGSGSVLGFHQAEVDPQNREWGDLNAWCIECDKVYAAEGEWNDASETFADITLVCSGCFFDMKARHSSDHTSRRA